MLKFRGSKPFAVKISSGASKQMLDGSNRQRILLPSSLPKGFVLNQQVDNLHRSEIIINTGIQAAHSAVNQTSVATIGELTKKAEANNDAFTMSSVKKSLNATQTRRRAWKLSLM
jgi:hypothetical protein